MDESRGVAVDEDLVRLAGFRRRRRGQRRLHLLHVRRARHLRVAAAAAARLALGLGRRRRRKRGRDHGCELGRRDGPGIRGISCRVPLIESTFELVAADRAVLITIGHGEQGRSHTTATAAPSSCTLRRLGRGLLGRPAHRHREHRATAHRDGGRYSRTGQSHKSLLENWQLGIPNPRTANRDVRTTVSEHIRVKCRRSFTRATTPSSIYPKSYSPTARSNGLHLTETTFLNGFQITVTFR